MTDVAYKYADAWHCAGSLPMGKLGVRKLSCKGKETRFNSTFEEATMMTLVPHSTNVPTPNYPILSAAVCLHSLIPKGVARRFCVRQLETCFFFNFVKGFSATSRIFNLLYEMIEFAV